MIFYPFLRLSDFYSFIKVESSDVQNQNFAFKYDIETKPFSKK